MVSALPLVLEQGSSGVLITVFLTPSCLSDLLDSPPTGSIANCWSDLFSVANAGPLFSFSVALAA